MENDNAEESFGKQIPPNPFLPSCPGTLEWLCPILVSLQVNSLTVSKSQFDFLHISDISLKKEILVAKKLFLVYFTNSAFLVVVNLTLSFAIEPYFLDNLNCFTPQTLLHTILTEF